MPQQVVEIPGVGRVEFPEGMTDDQISAAAAKLYAETQPKAAPPKMGMMEALMAGETATADPQVIQQQGKIIGRASPILGAMAGGALGGIPGAGLGAIAGEAANRGLNSEPITAKGLLRSGAEGAVGQALGPLLGKGIEKMGRVLGRTTVRGALRPSAALKREFGGSRAIADTVLDEKLVTSRVANRKLGESADEVRGMLTKAAPTAPPVRPEELLDDVMPVAARAAERGRLGRPDETDDILQRLQLMSSRNPKGIDLMAAQNLKQEAQDLAGRVYKARALGNDVTNLAAETDEAVASGLRKAIERRVPGVQGANQRTQRLMGAQRAMQQAEDRPNALTNLMSLATGSQSLATGAAMRGLGSSRLGTAAGVGINETGKALGNPEAMKAALLALLLGQ